MFKTKLPKKLYPSIKHQWFLQIDKLFDIMYERDKLLNLARETCLILEPIMLHTYTSKKIVHQFDNIPYNTFIVRKPILTGVDFAAGMDYDGDVMSYYSHNFLYGHLGDPLQMYPSIKRMVEYKNYSTTKLDRKGKIQFELPPKELSKIYGTRYKDIPLAGGNILDTFDIPVKNHHVFIPQ
ncbi:g031 [Yersinia phage phiR1-37]|uniref:hypothetical protein n=1 Tax=Yersinia phage phiR1-37 TaxID=331278 RepID=UPI00022DBCCB|nr:hypothetical protein phiR1-37_gp031 [Yersinia phage phiR1-37]CCE26055.1 g031 [Yersinia phage phiR1-37]